MSQDRATLQSNGVHKKVRILFGNTRSSETAFATHNVDPGSLVAGDIDRDGDVDLIWVGSPRREDAVVLINDGDGNFAAAADNTLYASELDDLLNNTDPSNRQHLKRGRKSSSLTSASFDEIALPLLTQYENRESTVASGLTHDLLTVDSVFARYIRKRGPPSFLS